MNLKVALTSQDFTARKKDFTKLHKLATASVAVVRLMESSSALAAW